MKYLRGALCAFIFANALSPTIAQLRGAITDKATPFAKGVVGIGANELVPANVINVLKVCTFIPSTKTDIGILDGNGYPTSAPTTNIGSDCNTGSGAGFYSGAHYTLRWPATRTFWLTVGGGGFNCTLVSGQAQIVNCPRGGPGAAVTIKSVRGQPGQVDLQITRPVFSFPAAGTYAPGSGEIALYRTSDAALYVAGQYWTNEFVNEVRALAPRTCRMMGLVQRGVSNWNGEVKWNYRPVARNLSWVTPLYPSGLLTASANYAIGGVDTYTAAAAPDTPGTITANEMFIGIVQNANLTTSPTLNIGGRGALRILFNGSPPTAGQIHGNNIYTFYYDAVLNAYEAGSTNAGGILAMIPIEAQVQLANLIGCDLWTNLPIAVDDIYATEWAQTIAKNLDLSRLKFLPECSNEVWNSSWPQTGLALRRGDAMGIAGASAYYGVCFEKMVADVTSVWPGGLTATSLQPVLSYQGATGTSNWTARFEGLGLCPATFGGSCAGNSKYDSFTGSANWSVAPNRPVDRAKRLAIAPYVTGANLCETPDFGCTPSSINVSFFQSLVSAWEANNAAETRRLIDNDVRNGLLSQQTVTCSGTTFTTPYEHGFRASSTDVVFTVVGGTSYSGISTYPGSDASAVYRVTSTPASNTFTIAGYKGGFPGGPNVNCGTSGSGILSVGISPSQNSQQTMLKMTNTWLAFVQASAERYNGGAGGFRPARMGNLSTMAYEGAIELRGLNDAQCASLRINSVNGCATDIANAIIDWQNSSLALQTQWDYDKQYMGTYAGTSNFGLMTYSLGPSQLCLNNCSPWGLTPSYPSAPGYAPYQTYYGFQSFNTNP